VIEVPVISDKFVVHAALLLGQLPPDWPEQHHLPEEPPGGGRVPEPRGPAAYGTDSRYYNGTTTVFCGTNTVYYPLRD
jgi:hypothetical protein